MEIIHETSGTEITFYRSAWQRGTTRFHWHEKIELVIPTEHPIGALIDGVWYEAAPNDILVIGEGKIHAFRVDEDNSGILLGQFPYRTLLAGGIVPRALSPLIKAEAVAAVPGLSEHLSALLEILVAECPVKREEKNPFVHSLCAALYFLLERSFFAPEAEKSEKKEKKDFSHIVSYVNEHFTEPITVGSVAKTFYVDRGKLSRLFMTYAGTSLNAYINTLRIGRAIQLIKGGAAITEAALEAGFQSVRTFHDVYRRTMQTTPRELKK